MKKRGASHVEVILAFVLFIVAVGFALYLFNPGQGDRIVESSLEYAFREIVKNTSTQVETFSVVIHNAGIVDDTVAFDFDGNVGKTRAETYNGTVLESFNGGPVYVRSTRGWEGIDFIFVRFGEEFNQTTGLSATPDESFYEIASSNVQEVLSERKMLELNNTYYTDYLDLKAEEGFNLPDRVNFGFTVSFSDGEEIKAEQQTPAGLNVFSEENRVEFLRTDGRIEYADLIVKVW